MQQMTDDMQTYMKIAEAAQQWEISVRRVQVLCAEGKIAGAMRVGRDWLLPRNALRPVDGRTKEGRAGQIEAVRRAEADMPLPRKTPFLYMSDLYSVPGTADEAAKKLFYHHEAQVLFEAEVAYSRGEVDKVYESANYLLQKHSGFYAVLSAGMLLAHCAIWKGDLTMWRRAKMHLFAANAKTENDRDIIALAVTAVDSMLYDVQNFPEWFKNGCFEPLHRDALPAAKVYYAKYLYAVGYALATDQLKLEGVQGLGLMSLLPCTVEPMISQAVADSTIMAEAYLRLTCAVIYQNIGREQQAGYHVDRALAIALPDRLYGLLAEYCRTIGPLIEQRLLAGGNGDTWKQVNALFRVYNEGWSKLSGSVRGRQLITSLSPTQREVAKLAAFGMSNQQIAEKLHLSLSSVKQAIRITSEKSGMRREDFAVIL